MQAPPGFGKTRILARLAVRTGAKTVFFVRSHGEALQAHRYISELGGRASLAFGRATLCKYGARTLGDCISLRERGICKVKYKYINKIFYNFEEIYKEKICPYEYFQSISRQGNITILPMSYLESQEYLAGVADLIRESELVIIDEFHNVLLNDLTAERDLPSSAYCDYGLKRCLLMPFLRELIGDRDLFATTASIPEKFSEIFVNFFSLEYINKDNIFYENLIIDIFPIKIRYNNRNKNQIINIIYKIVSKIFNDYKKLIIFIPNKSLLSYYKAKFKHLPVSEVPLGDVPQVILTYYNSPLSEGLNIDVDSAVLIGFPFPNITDKWLKIKINFIEKLGYNGFKYVYLFAAVSSAIQAMGRAMRELDRRVKYIAAIDDRFWHYRNYMPDWFKRTAVLRDAPSL
ncbi:helicase C-terminal domain-containing protein [Thermoproteus tenax]|uniref:helicase C-terminal domain-containing protein n=1 Tax=Thermoproteus tenax TaxID=2271 RepID=UPI001E64E2E0|nr:helicase C-terminal domain-containing protein [Thermoproteus tenax]